MARDRKDGSANLSFLDWDDSKYFSKRWIWGIVILVLLIPFIIVVSWEMKNEKRNQS